MATDPETLAEMRDLMQFNVEFARDSFKAYGSMGRILAFHGHDKRIMTVGFQTGTQDDYYRIGRLAAIASDARAVAVLAQASVVMETRPEPVPDKPPQPSRFSGRQEVVSVMILWRDDTNEIVSIDALMRIIRDADGKPVGLESLGIPGMDGDGEPHPIQGAMVELLPEKRPTPAERRKAREELDRAIKRQAKGKPPFLH